MSLRRPLAALIALAALGPALTIAGCNPLGGSGSDSLVVNVALVPGIDNATFALAERHGYFADAGVDVRLRRYRSDGAALIALSNGKAQVAFVDYGDLFNAKASGQVYRIIADGYDAGPGIAEIMTLPNSRVTSPAHLGGQKVAFPAYDQFGSNNGAPASLLQAAANSVLQTYGVNMTMVQWESTNPQDEIAALERRQVRAILVTEPYIYLAEQQGATELVDAYSGATSGIPLSGYVTTKAWYKAHPSLATAFRTAIEQAAMLASMPGPVQLVLPAYAHLTRQQAALVTLGTYPTGTIAASVQRTANLMAVQGMINYGLNVAAMIIQLLVFPLASGRS